ncbi:hypothetical protein [Thermotoga sp. KOL6]|uniref:hypothetical protein n=1 Tax=Thermotoga sp. KOL6 TaxID=126741 RepID=UPI000C78275C|nr:hypothetical protein [Thermotoga sp. KOL6]PLV59371.1 hypothetical protein AS005_06430 [Thermotoga sp. KOL6]
MKKIPIIKKNGEVIYYDEGTLNTMIKDFFPCQSYKHSFYISELRIEAKKKTYNVKITLKGPSGSEVSGESSGVRTDKNLPRLVGEAVANALNPSKAISVDDFQCVNLAGKKFVFVHLSFSKNGKEDWSVGVALFQGDFLTTMIFSVIDALLKSPMKIEWE